MIPICPVVSFTYGESNVARGGLCPALPQPRVAGRRGGWGQLRGGGGGRHPGVRVSEGVRGGRRTAVRPWPGRPGRLLTALFLSLAIPRRPDPLHGCPPAMGPDSPCPPQCPAGWGKMPKWRPATTLDSPTAGRRRRRLRPSIGNGSPPSPFPLPPRPAVGIPPTPRPGAAAAPAPAAPPGAQARWRAPHPPHTRPSLPSCTPPVGRASGSGPQGAGVGEERLPRVGDVEGRWGLGRPRR